MRWVKDTLPPRVRLRWLLRILRLTSRRRAGTTRKLVAVGTPRLASMFWAILAATPRSGWAVGVGAVGEGCGTVGVGAGAAAGGDACAAVAPLPPRGSSGR